MKFLRQFYNKTLSTNITIINNQVLWNHHKHNQNQTTQILENQ